MSATTDTAQQDLSYVRQLAESGAHSPLLGGRFMAWWGLLLTAAYLAHHFALAGAFGDDPTDAAAGERLVGEAEERAERFGRKAGDSVAHVVIPKPGGAGRHSGACA